MQVIWKSERTRYQRFVLPAIFNHCVYFIFALLFSLANATLAEAQTASGSPQDIPLNQIIEIKLPENAATVLLGNPDIADIISQGSSSVIVGGKRLGETNLLVKDRDQNMIINIALTVSVANTRNITIFSGASRTDYACTQSCEILKSSQAPDNQAPLNLKQEGVKR